MVVVVAFNSWTSLLRFGPALYVKRCATFHVSLAKPIFWFVCVAVCCACLCMCACSGALCLLSMCVAVHSVYSIVLCMCACSCACLCMSACSCTSFPSACVSAVPGSLAPPGDAALPDVSLDLRVKGRDRALKEKSCCAVHSLLMLCKF